MCLPKRPCFHHSEGLASEGYASPRPLCFRNPRGVRHRRSASESGCWSMWRMRTPAPFTEGSTKALGREIRRTVLPSSLGLQLGQLIESVITERGEPSAFSRLMELGALKVVVRLGRPGKFPSAAQTAQPAEDAGCSSILRGDSGPKSYTGRYVWGSGTSRAKNLLPGNLRLPDERT